MKKRIFYKCINRVKPYKYYPKYTHLIKCSHSPGSVTYYCKKLTVTRPDNLLNDLGIINVGNLFRI